MSWPSSSRYTLQRRRRSVPRAIRAQAAAIRARSPKRWAASARACAAVIPSAVRSRPSTSAWRSISSASWSSIEGPRMRERSRRSRLRLAFMLGASPGRAGGAARPGTGTAGGGGRGAKQPDVRSRQGLAPRGQQDRRDRGQELGERPDLDLQLALALGSEAVETGPPAELRAAPLGLDPAHPLQPVEGRVERPLLDVQRLGAARAQPARDAIAMQRAAGQGLQDEGVESAGEPIAGGLDHFIFSPPPSPYPEEQV